MKPKSDAWLTRTEAERLLQVTPQQFINMREEGRFTGHLLPGRKRPAYRESEILALKANLKPEPAPQCAVH